GAVRAGGFPGGVGRGDGARPPEPQERRARRFLRESFDSRMIPLTQTAILLAAAVVAVSLFRFARLSSILGYLAAGLVIGPWGLNLIGDVERITQVAQFGIVLLLFILGLQLP